MRELEEIQQRKRKEELEETKERIETKHRQAKKEYLESMRVEIMAFHEQDRMV